MKKVGVIVDGELRRSILPLIRLCHLAAAGEINHSHAITDPEKGNVELKNLRRDSRRGLVIEAGRAAGKNNAFRIECFDFFEGDVVGMNFAVNLGLAYAARYEL